MNKPQHQLIRLNLSENIILTKKNTKMYFILQYHTVTPNRYYAIYRTITPNKQNIRGHKSLV